MSEVFNGGVFGNDQVGQTKNIPPSMHLSYKRLLNPNPKVRLSTSHFLEQGRREGGFFDTVLIRLSEGVDSLGLKSDEERAKILRYLIPSMPHFLTVNSIAVNLTKYQKNSLKTL